MKDLQSLTGAKILSKKEQQSVKGGDYPIGMCGPEGNCGPGTYCVGPICYTNTSTGGGTTTTGPGKPDGPFGYDF